MKIVFTGPECSGKTTLATEISQMYNFRLVPEIAREYLNEIKLDYTYHDVRQIGLLQLKAEQCAINEGQSVVFDTDLLTILIWQVEKYGHYDDDLYQSWLVLPIEIYFLCAPDLPWEPDDLRENPEDRWRLYGIYREKMLNHKKPFIELTGNMNNRISSVNHFFKSDYNKEN